MVLAPLVAFDSEPLLNPKVAPSSGGNIRDVVLSTRDCTLLRETQELRLLKSVLFKKKLFFDF